MKKWSELTDRERDALIAEHFFDKKVLGWAWSNIHMDSIWPEKGDDPNETLEPVYLSNCLCDRLADRTFPNSSTLFFSERFVRLHVLGHHPSCLRIVDTYTNAWESTYELEQAIAKRDLREAYIYHLDGVVSGVGHGTHTKNGLWLEFELWQMVTATNAQRCHAALLAVGAVDRESSVSIEGGNHEQGSNPSVRPW